MIRKKLADLVDQKELNTLEKEQREIRQDNIIGETYLSWKQENLIGTILNDNPKDIIKFATYQAALADDEQKGIEALQEELDRIAVELDNFAKMKTEFEAKVVALEEQVRIIAEEIAVLGREDWSESSGYK